MKHMIKRGLILFMVIGKFLILLCCEKEPNSGEKTENSSHTTGVSSPQTISFNKILEIHEDWFDYGSLFMDDEGTLIYWQERDGTVAKFDQQGNRLLKNSIKSGQGYGDLKFFDFGVGGDRYLVWDKSNRRLNHFDKEFQILRSESIGSGGSTFALFIFRQDNKGNRYFLYNSMQPDESGWNGETGVAKYGTDGKKKMVFFRANSRLCDFKDNQMISYFHGEPFLRYRVDQNGAVWICDRREYKIYFYNYSGHLEKVIEKEYRKVPLKGKAEKQFRSFYRLDKVEARTTNITPDYLNPIVDFILMERHLLVLTTKNQWKKGKIAVDVFDQHGQFIHELEIPEFYQCYSLTNQFKSAICYGNGRLAALESDENQEKFWISLYEPRYEDKMF